MASILTTNTDTQLSTIGKLQERIANLSNVMSSEGQQSSYSELQGAGSYIANTAQLSSLDSSEKDYKSLITVQDFMQNQLMSVKAINVAFRDLLGKVTSPNPLSAVNFQNNVTSLLTQLTSVLNTRFRGENVFAGTATNNDAVIDLTTLGALASGAGVNTSYYKGNNQTVTLNLDSSTTVDLFAVNATNPAIEKLVRALRISLSADATDPTDPSLRAAMDLSNQVGTTDIGNAVVQLSIPTNIIQNSLDNIDPLRQSLVEEIQFNQLADFYETLRLLEDARANLEISEFLIMQADRDLAEFLKSI